MKKKLPQELLGALSKREESELFKKKFSKDVESDEDRHVQRKHSLDEGQLEWDPELDVEREK